LEVEAFSLLVSELSAVTGVFLLNFSRLTKS